MYKYFANRALGILYNFLLHECKHINTWLLPSQVCFSIPFLFLNLNKKIIFYDFGFSYNNITNNITNTDTDGVLIVDYFGSNWKDEDIRLIKSMSACLIHDKCLSIYDINANYEADLTIFSSGLGKIANLGYGGLGIVKKNINMAFSNDIDTSNYHKRYASKDTFWKHVINGRKDFSLAATKGHWIDTGNSSINSNYESMFLEQQKLSIAHKVLLNEVYMNIIPRELHFSQVSNIWRFNLLVDDNKKLLQAIFTNNLFASSHYANAAKYILHQKDLVISEFIERHIVNLFNDFSFSIDQAEKCATLICKLFHRNIIKPVVLNL